MPLRIICVIFPAVGSASARAGNTTASHDWSPEVGNHWSFTPSGDGDFEEVMKLIRYRPNGGVLRFGNLAQPREEGQPAPLSGGFAALIDADGYPREPLQDAQARQYEQQ